MNIILKKISIFILFWFVGWALCGATMMIGRSVTSTSNALIIHAVLAPIYFSAVSFVYFKQFNSTSPLPTAFLFTLLTILADALLIAPLVEKSYAMFTSFIGTWLVFILIFSSTYLTGTVLNRRIQHSNH